MDRAMFDQTQEPDTLIFLERELNKITNKFNIDWRSVKWENLTMPLYSALGAGLYMTYKSNRTTIPRSIEEQARYWNGYYRPTADANKFIQRANKLEQGLSTLNTNSI